MLQLQDRNAVSGQISELDQSLLQLEAVESRLSEELNELRTRIDGLRNQRAALKSRIAVVWSLPNEILAYIFEIGLKDQEETRATPEDGDDNDNPGHPSFNILVSHVCRAFRDVAIHTPTLWTEIHIFDLEPPRLDYVRACVQRSGCSLLDFSVYCDYRHLESDPKPIHQLMEILQPHIYRIDCFTARFLGFGALYHVMQHLNKPAPLLEKLDISDIDYKKVFNEDDPFDPPGLREPLTLFGGMVPKLESVLLDGAHVAWTKCNFKGLVKLQLRYHTLDVRPTYEEFKAIIDASPALQTLSLHGSAPLISDDTAGSSLYPPLRMERLEDLHFSEIPSDYATTLISLLITPNLVSLSLTNLHTHDYSAFFRRIIGPPILFPALTSLKLASIAVNDDAIEDLLRAFSKLTYLGLYFKGMPTSWLEFLAPRGPDYEVLCPKLERLRCVSASSFDLMNLLEKRRDAGFPIPTLQVDEYTANHESERFMKWIRENVTLETIEPSEPSADDDDTASDWASEDDEIVGFPYFSMEGFSDDEEETDDDEEEDPSDMDVDEIDDSGYWDE